MSDEPAVSTEYLIKALDGVPDEEFKKAVFARVEKGITIGRHEFLQSIFDLWLKTHDYKRNSGSGESSSCE